MGCSVTAILVVNNLRDIPTDRTSGKNTLAVVMGDRLTRWWYLILVGTAVLATLLTMLAGASPAVLISLAALAALAAPLRSVMTGTQGAPLNVALKQTARFHLALGLLFALGLAVS
jgi:1,4-dihydroxy-2-naphthoate octaprenyltransferase